MKTLFALIVLTVSISASAQSESSRTVTLNPTQSAVLRQNLSAYAANDGSIYIEHLMCRGKSIAFECSAIAGGERSHFGYFKGYRVFWALAERLNPIVELAKDNSPGLYNITVTELACLPNQACTLSTTFNDRF